VKKPAAVVKDTVKPVAITDTIDERDIAIREGGQFAVYSKRVHNKKENRLKLCIQLTSPDSVLNYCMNDSLLHDPEVAKVLFQQMDGDTNYVLVFADAFTKATDKPECDSGKETKLYFVRWHTKTNKAIWKTRTISSCMRAITNMTKTSIADWDGNGPLIVNYHKGQTSFVELRFDPANYKAGFQTADSGGKEN